MFYVESNGTYRWNVNRRRMDVRKGDIAKFEHESDAMFIVDGLGQGRMLSDVEAHQHDMQSMSKPIKSARDLITKDEKPALDHGDEVPTAPKKRAAKKSKADS